MKRAILFGMLVAALVFAGFACSNKQEAKKTAPKKPAQTKKVEQQKKALKELSKKAEETKKASVCYGSLEPGKDSKTVTINGKPYVFTGGVVKAPADEDKNAVIGVISDIKNDSPTNRAALKEYVDYFKKNGVEVIFVVGDTSEDAKGIENLLSVVLDSGLPVVVMMGNREPLAAYSEAIVELSKKYKNLINAHEYRVFDDDDFVVFSLPGYWNIDYVYHPKNACVYDKSELDKIKNAAAKITDKPVGIASHGPFKGEGKQALDFAVEGGNVGDPNMTQMIKGCKHMRFGMFGNIHEAGGKAVGADLKTVLKQNTPSDKLFMNVGPADTDPWEMNDGTISHGMCGIIKITDGKLSYEIHRRKPADDEAKKPQAEKKAEPAKKQEKQEKK